MDNIDLVKLKRSIEKAVHYSKGSRAQILKRAPIKLLYSKLLEIIAIYFEKSVNIKANTFWNGDMVVTIPERVSLSIYRYGYFEEDLTTMILEYLKPGMIFFDIGAHFGYFSLLGSILVGDKGQVHSFEPTPSTFKILEANGSNKHNVAVNNCAVGSKNKSVVLNDYGVRYSAFNSVYGARLPQNILSRIGKNKYEVTAITIDGYVKQNNTKPDFIKIDAESSEYEILIGMEETIDNWRPIITIEVGDIISGDVPQSKELVNILRAKDYRAWEFKEGKIVRHNPETETYEQKNLLFLPTEMSNE